MSSVKKDFIKLTQVNSRLFSGKFGGYHTNFFIWRNTYYETKRGLDKL